MSDATISRLEIDIQATQAGNVAKALKTINSKLTSMAKKLERLKEVSMDFKLPKIDLDMPETSQKTIIALAEIKKVEKATSKISKNIGENMFATKEFENTKENLDSLAKSFKDIKPLIDQLDLSQEDHKTFDVNTTDFEDKIRGLKTEIENIKKMEDPHISVKGLRAMNSKLRTAYNQSVRLRKSYEKINAELSIGYSMKRAGVQEIDIMGNALGTVSRMSQKSAKSLKDLPNALEGMEQSIEPFKISQKIVKSIINDAEKSYRAALQLPATFQVENAEKIVELSNNKQRLIVLTNRLKDATGLTEEAKASLNKEITLVTSKISKFNKQVATAGDYMEKIAKQSGGIGRTLGEFGKMIRRQFFLRAIRQVMNALINMGRKGFTNIQNQSESTRSAFMQIRAATLTLTNTIGSLMSSLLRMRGVVTVVRGAVNVLTNAINNLQVLLMSLRFIDYFYRAVEITEEYADALDRAKSAGAGFDELNVIGQQDDTFGEFERVERDDLTTWERIYRTIKGIGAAIAGISLASLILGKGTIAKFLGGILLKAGLWLKTTIATGLAKIPIISKMVAKLGLMWAKFTVGVKKHSLFKVMLISFKKLWVFSKKILALLIKKLVILIKKVALGFKKLTLFKFFKGIIAALKKIKLFIKGIKLIKVALVLLKLAPFILVGVIIVKIVKGLLNMLGFLRPIVAAAQKLFRFLNPIRWFFGGRRSEASVDINYNHNVPSFGDSPVNSSFSVPNMPNFNMGNTTQNNKPVRTAEETEDIIYRAVTRVLRSNPDTFSPNVEVNIDGRELSAIVALKIRPLTRLGFFRGL